jgi:hypothetical protein
MQSGNNYTDFVGLANTNNFIPKTYKVADMDYFNIYFTNEHGQRKNIFHKQNDIVTYLQFKVEMEAIKMIKEY